MHGSTPDTLEQRGVGDGLGMLGGLTRTRPSQELPCAARLRAQFPAGDMLPAGVRSKPPQRALSSPAPGAMPRGRLYSERESSSKHLL